MSRCRFNETLPDTTAREAPLSLIYKHTYAPLKPTHRMTEKPLASQVKWGRDPADEIPTETDCSISRHWNTLRDSSVSFYTRFLILITLSILHYVPIVLSVLSHDLNPKLPNGLSIYINPFCNSDHPPDYLNHNKLPYYPKKNTTWKIIHEIVLMNFSIRDVGYWIRLTEMKGPLLPLVNVPGIVEHWCFYSVIGRLKPTTHCYFNSLN